MTIIDTPPRGASPAAIQHHYDASNEFYALWLDEERAYSCAMWSGLDTLEEAQLRKFDWIGSVAGAEGAARVLDVGCGWGGLLRRLVSSHRVESGVGLTLSPAQAEWAAGYKSIDIRVEDWADHEPTAPYDAIVSVGAFEHFAKPGLGRRRKLEAYRSFFEACHDWLRPGGRLALQTIGVGGAACDSSTLRELRFISKEIFPESVLPRLEEVLTASSGLFELVLLRNDRQDYARTFRAWSTRLESARDEAVALVGEQVVCRYERYFRACEAMFSEGQSALFRFAFAKTS